MKPQDRTRRILKSTLEPSQKLLLVAIADHMEDTTEGEDRNSRPSVALLCQETGLGERAVQGHLKALEGSGALVRHQLPGHRTPHYQIRWDRLPAQQSLPPQNLRPAESAPRRICAPTPAESAPLPPQNLRPRQTTQATIKATTPLPPSPSPESESVQTEMDRHFGKLAQPLANAGITTLDQLCQLTAHQTRMLRGIGEGNVALIQVRLAGLGRTFAGERAPVPVQADVKKRAFTLEAPSTNGKSDEQRRTSAGT